MGPIESVGIVSVALAAFKVIEILSRPVIKKLMNGSGKISYTHWEETVLNELREQTRILLTQGEKLDTMRERDRDEHTDIKELIR